MSTGGICAFTFSPDDGVPPGVAPFAHATSAGPTLYVTGQMPTDVTGAVVGDDVATQTHQVLGNLLRVTQLCGGDLTGVVLTDSVNSAASHIRSSLNNPLPAAGGRSARTTPTDDDAPAGRRLVDRITHNAKSAVHAAKSGD